MLNRVPRGVWMLGFVSLFMDMSSEMAHAVLPLFLTGTLGASVALVGLIEGLAEALSQVMKLFSGVASDAVRSRKWLALLGYGLSALSKPLFPLAATPAAVLLARLADRLGKGIRGSPRDAMVADFTPPELRGAAYGLRQALDTVGAVAGPLIAVVLLVVWQLDLRSILWVACVPAIITVLVLALGVEEPQRSASPPKSGRWREAFRLAQPGRAFWLVLALGVAVSVARMSEAFLVLKAQDAQLSFGYIPLVMVVMSLVYAVASFPAGLAADRWGTRGLLAAGLGTLALADVLLMQSSGVLVMFAGIALWGLHMGLTQGLLGKLVADAAPAHLRGTCFGYFNLASGLATLVSSSVAGLLWMRWGAAAAFAFGLAASLLALLLLALWRPIAAYQYRSG